jgi:uncharacterized membrane protein YkgB
LAQIKYYTPPFGGKIMEVCMKKTNRIFGMMLLIVGIMLVFSFASCDLENLGGGVTVATVVTVVTVMLVMPPGGLPPASCQMSAYPA